MTTQPVSLSRDLIAKQVMRAELGRVDMAVWRSTCGVVSAWENRCPHRGMRLSHGFVRGESLACAYHGWHYNCEGACHYIPAHPELEPPKTIRPTVYNVAESGGIVWVNATGTVQPVAFPTTTVAVRSISLQCSVDSAVQSFESNAFLSHLVTHCTPNLISQAPKVLAFTPNATVGVTHNDANAISVFIAFQPMGEQAAVAHVLASDNANVDDCLSLSRWCSQVQQHPFNSAIGH